VGDRRLARRHRGVVRAHGRDGVVAGYVLKVARESVGVTQPALAAALDVDAGTLQSWESGRRSLAGTSVRDFVRLRLRLLELGVDACLIGSLDDALSADHILGAVLHSPPEDADPGEHPLAAWLLPRAVSTMLAWPLLGRAPAGRLAEVAAQRRRGPVPAGPVLTSSERTRFFEHLRRAADRLRGSRLAHHDRRALFAHQAYYRAAWDTSPASTRWLRMAYTGHTATSDWQHRWSADWLGTRALVLALSFHGDPEPLRHFVRAGFQSDEVEIANLNYWAYWVGELREPQRTHQFMPRADVLNRWSGERLTAHLAGRLAGGPDLELNVHSLARLLERPAPRHLLEHDTRIAGTLRLAADRLTAGPAILSPHALRLLDRIVALTPAARSRETSA
jgi:transcriptional regulator with XRE-family HTH domain